MVIRNFISQKAHSPRNQIEDSLKLMIIYDKYEIGFSHTRKIHDLIGKWNTLTNTS